MYTPSDQKDALLLSLHQHINELNQKVEEQRQEISKLKKLVSELEENESKE